MRSTLANVGGANSIALAADIDRGTADRDGEIYANFGNVEVYRTMHSDRGKDIDKLFVVSTLTPTQVVTRKNSAPNLAGAEFGAAVGITDDGKTVYVGAPGGSRLLTYDLTGSNLGHWNVKLGDFTGNPLRSAYNSTVGHEQFGAELLVRDGKPIVGGRRYLEFEVIGSSGNPPQPVSDWVWKGAVNAYNRDLGSNSAFSQITGQPGLGGDEALAARQPAARRQSFGEPLHLGRRMFTTLSPAPPRAKPTSRSAITRSRT